MNRGEFNFAQPWMIPDIIAVTGSAVRRGALIKNEIPIEDDELYLTPSGRAELFHQNGRRDLIVGFSENGIPYPLKMAGIKNQAIRPVVIDIHGSSGWPPHATIDSTFVVLVGSKLCAINKHHGEKDRVQALVKFYYENRGAQIYSNSGIEVLTPREEYMYHFRLFLGILNPDLDSSVLENVIWNHPICSGGMTTQSALDNEIIIPDPERPFPHLTVEQIGDRRPFLFGRIVLGTNAAILNYEQDLFLDAAIGILPKNFSFA